MKAAASLCLAVGATVLASPAPVDQMNDNHLAGSGLLASGQTTTSTVTPPTIIGMSS